MGAGSTVEVLCLVTVMAKDLETWRKAVPLKPGVEL